MRDLELSEINDVGGGHFLKESMINVNDFSKLDGNIFKGGILLGTLNPLVRKEKKFPDSLALLD